MGEQHGSQAGEKEGVYSLNRFRLRVERTVYIIHLRDPLNARNLYVRGEKHCSQGGKT